MFEMYQNYKRKTGHQTFHVCIWSELLQNIFLKRKLFFFYLGEYILILSAFITDGSLQAWTDWLSCSVSCGGGKRHRFRHCHPQPMHGGVCIGDGEKRMEVEDCNTDECPRKYNGKAVFILIFTVAKCTYYLS